MKRVAITTVVVGMTGLLLALLVCAAGAQPENPPPPPPAQLTYGAPAGLRDTAVTLEGLFKQKKYAEAHALCQQGYAAATDDEIKAFYLRYDAETYMEERSPQCEPVLKQVIAQYAGTAQASWATMDLGEAYVHAALVIGNTEHYSALAMTYLGQFISAHPAHERIARAYWWRALLQERQGNYQAALTDYQKAADLYPTYPNGNECLMGAIKLLQKFERWDDAITYAQRYIQLLPQFNPAAAQLTIGFSYAGKGDLAGAITEFDKVVTQYPGAKDDCAKALFQKGLSQKALGQTEAAVQTFQQLKQDYPDDALASQAQQQLDALAQ